MKRLFQRACHLWLRIVKETGAFSFHKKNFGFKIAFRIFCDGIIPPGKSAKYISAVEAYVDRYTEPLVEKYLKESESADINTAAPVPEAVPVWCCWWQGEENMPEIVKMCNSRLKQVLPSNARLIMLNKDNYSNYIEFPAHITEKFEKGLISITALSDIMRVMLIAKHGGFWIDSTVFLSGEFPKEFISGEFFTQRMLDPVRHAREACKGRWCGFLVAGKKDSLLFRYLSEAFCSWWADHDCVIDYVIYDYFLLSAYKKIPFVRELIDSVPDNNTDIFEMYKVLHLPYTPELLGSLTATTSLHKLTYKIDLIKTTDSNKKTLYAHLLECVNSGIDIK